MDTPSSSMRDLARRLLTASKSASPAHVHPASMVFEKLRISLVMFAGVDGFTSLLKRALVLASREVPSLEGIQVSAEGQLEGLEKLAVPTGDGEVESEGVVEITAQLLGLLATFIGDPLTLTLVRDAWPEVVSGE